MTAPSLESLYSAFPAGEPPPATAPLAAAELPGDYRGLLDHPHHMTVTVEEHYGEPVTVEILDAQRDGPLYSRKIVLRLRDSGRPVQFGIVRIRLDRLAPEVQADILAGQTPLGRVLIQHDVLRTVNPLGFFAVTPPEPLAGWLDAPPGAVTYGRLGVITADGRAAVAVAEILAPLRL